MPRNPTRRDQHTIGLLVTFFLLVSALVTVTDSPATATPPGANGKIAYVKNGAVDAIWTMDDDGSNQTALTPPAAGNQYEPAWSPDGATIAFRIDPFAPGVADEIVSWVFGGSTLVNLTNTLTVDESEPVWSPDGTKIAYVRSGSIWTMNADGSGQARLTFPPMTISHARPAWSPDGTKIAYERHWAIESIDIEVVNADGTGTTNLTQTPTADEFEPSWSPDGTTIAYRKEGLVWTMNVDGSDPDNLTTFIDGLTLDPFWSPDGTKLVYRFHPTIGTDDISVTNADGTDRINLTNTVGVDESEPAWQPLNRPPVAVDDTYAINMNMAIGVLSPGVLGNDSDPDGNTLTVNDPSGVVAANGTVNMAANGSFGYTPNPGFSGIDSFTYSATDGITTSNAATVSVSVFSIPGVGLVDPATGQWHLDTDSGTVTTFYYGNPGDVPFMGDWNCDGIDTPGLYRQSDGYVYLRNSNTQGVADITFFFGNPGDVPLAGDFNGDGCDTLSLYRPSEARFYIINELGEDEGGLGAA
ncbi:MAG: Ig-like domain-containing protein, partial [Acidimicrobiia bacterium]